MSTIEEVHGRLITTGARARAERVAEDNQLLRIEDKLGDRARNAGIEAVATT